MKVYIMTDQEGTAGVVNSEDYARPGARYYEVGRTLTTLEVNAAIEGAIEAGATEFLVVAGHGNGEALDPLLLHPAAKLRIGLPIRYPYDCDASFDAAFMVGQHAKANTVGGHLAHTGSFTIDDLTINGVSVGELGCNVLFASYFNVPTVMLAGDRAACDEIRGLIPSVSTAAVKEGAAFGPLEGVDEPDYRRLVTAATHIHPTKARELIRDAARRGIERRREIERFWLAPPYELVSRRRPAPDRPAATARVTGNDLIEVLNTRRVYE